MANVRGPTNALTGHSHAVPDGMHCDAHPDRLAVARVTGEVDSFGSEQHDLCQECIDEFRKEGAEARIGRCDWCGTEQNDLRQKRDFEEGMCGRVYNVCGKCVISENQRLKEDSSYDDDYYGDDDD